MIPLHVLTTVPDGLMTCTPEQVIEVVRTPCILDLNFPKCRHPEPLVLSVLLHGNETSSLFVLQRLLRAMRQEHFDPPRPLLVIIGNVEAARYQLRHLPGQRDFNRIWARSEGAEARWADEVLSLIRSRRPFAAIDVHNNTGRNPHYSCVSRLDPDSIGLSLLFSNTMIYSREPSTTFSVVTSDFCPSITLECGLPGAEEGISHAFEAVNTAWHLDRIHGKSFGSTGINLYHSLARLFIQPGASFTFSGERRRDRDITIIRDLDKMNFLDMPSGTLLGWSDRDVLRVVHDTRGDVTAEYLDRSGEGEIRTRQGFIPAMLTEVPEVIEQDCLGYVMEPLGSDTIS